MNPNTTPAVETFRPYFQKSEHGQIYWEEHAILDFTEEVLRRMKDLGVSKSDLAARLSVDPAYITKLIGGSNNFTLKTMVKLSRALQAELKFHLQPQGHATIWTEYKPLAGSNVCEIVMLMPTSTYKHPPMGDFSNGVRSASFTMTSPAQYESAPAAV
jgi:plasmid maintenance system antidote protein VapI